MPGTPAVLHRRLSTERLAPYRAACGGDLGRAIALYGWNTDIAAAFWATLGYFEILMRNAMHEQLTRWSQRQYDEPRWYTDPGQVFSMPTLEAIQEAWEHATRNGRRESPGRVVTELSFGFWRFLLTSYYERTLWRPCLRHAFQYGPGLRRVVHDKLFVIHNLRNRLAHHEPIHNRPLAVLRAEVIEVAGWISPQTQAWIDSRCTVSSILARRPS